MLAATDDERRLPVAMEMMPGWDIFPFELDTLRIKPLEDLAEAEPPRSGEDPAECWCAQPQPPVWLERAVWHNDRWVLTMRGATGLPIDLNLMPLEHCDLSDVPAHLHAEMGQLIVEISAAVEALPSVSRSQVAKYGDGGAHLHLFFFGRPDRMLQLRGSTLLDWEENMPRVPVEVLRDNAAFVGQRLVDRVGGQGPAWLKRP